MGYVIGIKSEDGESWYVSRFRVYIEGFSIKPQLTKDASKALVEKDIRVISRMCHELMKAEYLVRIIPTTRESGIEWQHCILATRFPQPANFIRFVVEADKEIFFRNTQAEAERAGQIIGFMVMTHNEHGEYVVDVHGVPLISDLRDEKAASKVQNTVMKFAAASQAYLNEGEQR